MPDDIAIGLVVPFATDRVPDEGLQMYPDLRFVARGVGVRALTEEGYDAAVDGIVPAAEYLAGQDVDAIMVIGTSLTFYRGADFHAELIEKLRAATGLPVSTMSEAVVDGLRSLGARRNAVATAYADDVNDACSLPRGAWIRRAGAGRIRLVRIRRARPQERTGYHRAGRDGLRGRSAAEGLLISCGGLRTLGVAVPLERQYGIPVVASTQAAFWAALRLAGANARLAGHGRMLAQPEPVAAVAAARAASVH